ncbi:MAG TPA: hypothetical protein VFS43_12845 [Polyangiaceae bacterium]|nr:hypothetical protein [Polyangiaceae bacterium]
MTSMLLAAAISGILSGSADDAAGVRAAGAGPTNDATPLEGAGDDKHACKGKNACKGKGGCKTDKNACKGQNECAGKGGCRTDGSGDMGGRKLATRARHAPSLLSAPARRRPGPAHRALRAYRG